MPDKPLHDREVIIEFFPVGTYMKVTAMDTATMTEVVTQGPASAGKTVLEHNALKRLEYVMKKKGLIA
jgi:hypothetical protein